MVAESNGNAPTCAKCNADISDRSKFRLLCVPCERAGVAAAEMDDSILRYCRDCGADISERHHSAKRCVPCANAKGHEHKMRHRAEGKLPPPVDHKCEDCGADLTGEHPQKILCEACLIARRNARQKRYKAARDAREADKADAARIWRLTGRDIPIGATSTRYLGGFHRPPISAYRFPIEPREYQLEAT